MSGVMRKEKQPLSGDAPSLKRKWHYKEEVALVEFIKKNPAFEQPCSRLYYTRFLFQSEIDVGWKLVRCKVRNMRVTYRRTKERQIHKQLSNCNPEVVKNQMIKSCWYLDDFDILFPNEMNKCTDKSLDPIFDDEFFKDELYGNIDNSTKNTSYHEEEQTMSSFSKSIDGDISAEKKSLFAIKKEDQKEDIIEEVELPKAKSSCENVKSRQQTRYKEVDVEPPPFRNRSNPVRKWKRNEEVDLIRFLKENRDFEMPIARIYYTKFITECGVDIDWPRIRSKVRNMRMTYRRAKDYEVNQVESEHCDVRALRNQILKICWYVDDFDIIFPSEMDSSNLKYTDAILDDEFSKDDSISNIDNSSKNLKNESFVQEDSTMCSFPKSINEDVFRVQRDVFNLNKQKLDENDNIKEKELELAKEKLKFEMEKFQEEVRLKEKEIEIEERLKIMEFEIKEKIAIKELEIEEKLALRSIEKPESSYNNVYHNLT